MFNLSKIEDLINIEYSDCIIYTKNYTSCIWRNESVLILSHKSLMTEFIMDENPYLSPKLTAIDLPLNFRQAMYVSFHFDVLCKENEYIWMRDGKKYNKSPGKRRSTNSNNILNFLTDDFKSTWDVTKRQEGL